MEAAIGRLDQLQAMAQPKLVNTSCGISTSV
jgi:hypothetical protein